MSEDIILHSTSKSDLKTLIAETFKEELTTFFSKNKKSDDRLRTRKETAEILGISLPTLSTWTKSGVIKAFRIGNSVRYKAEDINNALNNIQSIKYLRNRF